MTKEELIKELNNKSAYEMAEIFVELNDEAFTKAFLLSLLPIKNKDYSKDFFENLAQKAYQHYLDNEHNLLDESLAEVIDNAMQEKFENIQTDKNENAINGEAEKEKQDIERIKSDILLDADFKNSVKNVDDETIKYRIEKTLKDRLLKIFDINEKLYEKFIENQFFKDNFIENVFVQHKTNADILKCYNILVDVKDRLKKWEAIKKYDIDFDNIRIDMMEDNNSKIAIFNRIGGDFKDIDSKNVNLYKENNDFELQIILIRMINNQIKLKNKSSLGYIDIFKDWEMKFSSGRGFSTNDHSVAMGEIENVSEELYRNGFVILSNELRAVAVDREDEEVCDSENALATFGNLIDYEKFKAKYNIDEKTLYEEAHCLYTQVNEEFLGYKHIREKTDSFLKNANLDKKCAIVASGYDVLEFQVVPLVPSGNNVLDDYIMDIPKISTSEKQQIANFLETLKNEYKELINDRFDSYLNSEYEVKEQEDVKSNQITHKRK